MSGLPTDLPKGEKLLWQGRPNWRILAVRGFHLRGLAIYFAVILCWCLVQRLRSDTPAGALVAMAYLTGVALLPLALIVLYSWMTSRGTIYTVTSRRVMIRLGLAVPMTINIPFNKIASAGADIRADGSGDIVLQLAERGKLSWFVLWPNTRPWRMARPEPMLRALPQAGQVAQVLARGLAASASVPVQPIAAAGSRAPARVAEARAVA